VHREFKAFTPQEAESFYGLAVSYHGELIAAGSRTVRVFMADGRRIDEYPIMATDYWNPMEFSKDDRLLAIGCHDRIVRIVDIQNHSVPTSLSGCSHSVNDVSFSPDGKRIVASCDLASAPAIVWDVASGVQVAAIDAHTKHLCAVEFSSGGEKMLTASRDETVHIWSTKRGNHMLGGRSQ
jgi:WD40 repeat protein